MRRQPRARGVAAALMRFLFHVVVFVGGALFVVIRTWQSTRSRLQTTLAAILFAAIIRIISTQQRLARRRRMSESLPRYYDSRGTTAL